MRHLMQITFFLTVAAWVMLISPQSATAESLWEHTSEKGTVTLESIETILENEEEDINFPWMVKFDDDIIWLVYHLGEHTVSEYSTSLWSSDNGQTWSEPDITIRGRNITPLSDGSVVAVVSRQSWLAMKNRIMDTYFWPDPTTAHQTVSSYCEFPWKTTFLAHRSTLVLPDGSLLATGYGRVEGQDKYRAMCIRSTDGGQTWQYHSTIAYHPEVGSMEGYNENVVVLLEDESLLAVIRVNAYQPARQTRSTDGGLTWSEPTAVPGNAQGVSPDMVLMSNGALVLSIGTRPGIDFYVDWSGTGQNWEKMDWPYLEGDGYYCAYTAIAEVEPNVIMLVVPQSDFLIGPDYDGVNKLQKAYIRVEPRKRADLTGDGTVNFADFTILASQWGHQADWYQSQ